jgi:opacity protein-like surface antigen
MFVGTRWMHLFALVLAAMPLQAAAQVGSMFAPERVGRWSLSGALGGYSEETNSQLGNQDGEFGLAISGGYRLTPYVSLEVDGLVSQQEIDTPATLPPPFTGSGSGRSDLNTGGIGGLVKFILPMGRVELFAGGGLGVYTTTLRVEGTVLGAMAELEEDDTDIGYQAVAGADFYVSCHVSVGLEYRKFSLDASFGNIIPGDLDMGGDFFFATVRGHF